MKALTIWQPWASLIMAGAKPFEFRSWRFPSSMIGQRIVIHAGARPVRRGECEDLIVRLNGRDAWTTGLHAEKAMSILGIGMTMAIRKQPGGLFDDDGPAFDPLPIAAGLGTVTLGKPIDGAATAATFGAVVNDSDRHEHMNWGWPMLDIEPWAEPIAMRGAQGFWEWPEPKDVGL